MWFDADQCAGIKRQIAEVFIMNVIHFKDSIMKLTEVIEIWDILHLKDVGDLGFCDLEKAIESVIGIENDIPEELPILEEV